MNDIAVATSVKPALMAEPKTSALAIMANRLGADPVKLLDTLKATVFKGASNEELLSLIVVSNVHGLNPLARQIYAFPGKGGGITPVVSVDGWLHIINSQPQFDGIEFEYADDADGKPVSCTAIVHRKDRTHATRVTEYFAECAGPTEPWRKMPRRMLRHKAVKESARVAFGISGITDEDEARDIVRNETAAPAVRKPIFSVKLEPQPSPEAPIELTGGDLFEEVSK